jgi:20S proteasome subunit alpha 5
MFKKITKSLKNYLIIILQNHWFTYNEKMSVESVTQAVSNLALAFGDDDSEQAVMVCFFVK